MNHTKGPWELEYDGSLCMKNQVIAEPRWLGPDTASLEECKANARLIAAAPELLEALEKAKSAVEWMADATDSDPEDKELLEYVNSVIAKARGE